MSQKLITLTPIGKFYFGSDTTFKTKPNSSTSNFASYIVKSNKFPQQTSLLGMLRFLILSNDTKAFSRDNQCIDDSKIAEKIIGKSSFKFGEKEQSFGLIQKIGSCFLQMREKKDTEWENLFVAPMDHGLQVFFEEHTKGSYNQRKIQIPEIKGYDPKEYREPRFLSTHGDVKKLSDIFTEDSRIGINKNYKGKSEDSGYFKQISYRLGKKDEPTEYRFAFYAEITENSEHPFPAQEVVSIGGDSSQFMLQAYNSIEESTYPEIYKKSSPSDCYARVILSSDSYIEEKDCAHALFSINDTLPFRYLETNVETKDYHILTEEVKRSKERYDLYQKGSVFYFENETSLLKFTDALESYSEFRKIGYNEYQIIK